MAYLNKTSGDKLRIPKNCVKSKLMTKFIILKSKINQPRSNDEKANQRTRIQTPPEPKLQLPQRHLTKIFQPSWTISELLEVGPMRTISVCRWLDYISFFVNLQL